MIYDIFLVSGFIKDLLRIRKIPQIYPHFHEKIVWHPEINNLRMGSTQETSTKI